MNFTCSGARETTMVRQMMGLAGMVVLALGTASAPVLAQDDIGATGAGTGVYPPNTSFSAVALSGLKFGFGLTIAGDRTADGQFHTTLLGTSALGQTQNIDVT